MIMVRIAKPAFFAMAAFVMIASYDESLTAEAIVGLGHVPMSKYIVNERDYPAIVPINNYWTNCPNGRNSCVYKYGSAKGKMKSVWNVSCAGTVIGKKHVISARHCFCRDGKDLGYTAGFWMWIDGKRYKAKRTHVPPGCGWGCRDTGHPNQCDVAIVELERRIVSHRVKPYPIYSTKRFGSELGKNFEFYGWGVAGKANTATGRHCDKGVLDKKFRRRTYDPVRAPQLLKGELWPFTRSPKCGKSFPCPHLRSLKVGLGSVPLKFVRGHQTRGKKCRWNSNMARYKDSLILTGMKYAHRSVQVMMKKVKTASGKVNASWRRKHNLVYIPSYMPSHYGGDDHCHPTVSKGKGKGKKKYKIFYCRRRRTKTVGGMPVKKKKMTGRRRRAKMASRAFRRKHITVAFKPLMMFVEYARSIKGHNRKWTRKLRGYAKRVAKKWLKSFSRFLFWRKMPSLNKLLHVILWRHDLGMSNVKMVNRAKKLFHRAIKGRKCKICYLVGRTSLAKALAGGGMPDNVKNDDIRKLLAVMGTLERANFVFKNKFKVDMNLTTVLTYLRRYEPKMIRSWEFKSEGGHYANPVDVYKNMCQQRGGCWMSPHWAGRPGVHVKNMWTMSDIPKAVTQDGAVALPRRQFKWVFNFMDKWLPSLLRGRYTEMLGQFVGQYRQAGMTEKNSDAVCWGTVALMRLHRRGGRFRPRHYSIGASAETVFHWTWMALDGMRDRHLTVDRKYGQHIKNVLRHSQFTQRSSGKMSTFEWRKND